MADLQYPASMAHPSPAPSFRSRPRAPSNGRSRSRPSLRRRDSSPPSSPPPSLPTPAFSPDGQTDEDDIIEDTLSPFDPRRITPTLHASLVSEILSLRREIENKTKSIDVLEDSLDQSRTENETLTANLSQTTWEGRSLKHQIQLLEGGTSSAMTELARERDEAVENIGDVRKKLEQAQKKARSREEDLERTQLLWSRDQESWADERRALERKVHVVEGRLKTVLNEVAAAQEVATIHSSQPSENGGLVHDKNKESDSASVASSSLGRRRTSVTSVSSEEGEEAVIFHSMRYSVMSVAPGVKNGSGLNLAEELDFDEEDEFDPSDDELPVSPEALPEERPMSVHSQGSHSISSKARKILGLSLQSSDSHSPTAMEFRARDLGFASSVKLDSAVECRDIGIQYSPPPSPATEAKVVDIGPESRKMASEPENEDDNANIPETKDSVTIPAAPLMVSTSCQTLEELPTPSWALNVTEPPQPVQSTLEQVQMTSTSTQTDVLPETDVRSENRISLLSNNVSSKMDIPMIAIHPPGSEPPSPRNSVVLPPQTKNIACQANFRAIVDCRSVAIQTEEIRIDQRPVKLPASLLPSAIQDALPRPEPQGPSLESYTVPPLPPRSEKRQRRLITDHPIDRPVKPPRAPVPDHVQAYPGNNDNGPLSDDALSNIRRPLRSSSLFAGFEHNSDDEGPHGERDVFTDDELLNRPFAAYTVSRGKLITSKSRPSLDDVALPEVAEQLSSPESRPPDIGRSRASQRSGTASSSIRQPGMRKIALISSGAAAHQKPRARSPSEPSIESGSAGSSIAPPFPVPMRLSSRKLPFNGSDGPPSPTRSAGRQFSDRGRQPVVRRPTLRRVRSAAATSQSELTEGPETRSSPSRSISTFSPESPTYRPYRLPPMPCDEITAPREQYGPPKRASHRATPSQTWNREQRERKDSTGGVQPTSVVDAIAQTMVGEWMFKYVRRRKSFGMGESKEIWEGKNPDDVSANITNSGVRHKRWVWLAPYEGSIMWSSKQPTSGPALLGKSGRKFTIQSVLDVKDDNPLPKGAGPSTPFNRSILVLTPQRALKFTALTVERHYVWLTALSFLSHSSMGLQELAALPPVPQEESPTLPHAFHRRNPIRDSIRVAKGRPRPMPKGKRSFNSAGAPAPVPEIPSGSIDLAADAPHVPRFSTHNRKRSNTAPRPPALHALRSFSSAGTMPSSHSGTTVGSPELHFPAMQPPAPPPGIGSRRSSISRRTSEASGRAPSVAGSNMFDIGTVRMEAFIDHHAEQINRPRAPPRQLHTRKTSSQWSERRYEFDTPSVQGSEFSYRPEDPWRGF
ncbi:Pleckstrin homology domain Mcp5-type [Penicillium concentricum]|uniref:Pleckstrin homology domain Mcp5-type n=1 Tax=Penicillium concentricum TaxID=293559 RepID=A0A9W9RSX8_9EURO|nr:Pleckstrin homology domain Mcp5-type [Penicillium concentricum]KAJ5365055.1 Pleckstrin homology domain Mcp5-type [Penicillium concentricum]